MDHNLCSPATVSLICKSCYLSCACIRQGWIQIQGQWFWRENQNLWPKRHVSISWWWPLICMILRSFTYVQARLCSRTFGKCSPKFAGPFTGHSDSTTSLVRLAAFVWASVCLVVCIWIFCPGRCIGADYLHDFAKPLTTCLPKPQVDAGVDASWMTVSASDKSVGQTWSPPPMCLQVGL